MHLNIKDPEAHRLAYALSRATGQSMRQVVTDALRERQAKLDMHKGKANVEELLAIADRAAVHLTSPCIDHGELLYDRDGLPK